MATSIGVGTTFSELTQDAFGVPTAENKIAQQINNTVPMNSGLKAISTYCFPESLDTIPNTNCIVFEIMGEADIGIDFTKSQRTNGEGANIVSNVGSSLLNAIKSTPEVIQAIGDGLSEKDFSVKPKPVNLGIVIKLPFPMDGVDTKYGVQYEDTPLGLGGALANMAASGQNLGDLMKSGKTAVMRALAGYATGQMGDKMNSKSGLTAPGATLEAVTRTILNPRKEQLFRSVNYRVFNYSFHFAPNNPAECFAVREILRLFKTHMMPTLESAGFYLRYPSEFVISYMYNEGNNPFINKIGNCVLTQFEIKYGIGSFSTLMNGSPTYIVANTSFQELEPLTRNRLQSESF